MPIYSRSPRDVAEFVAEAIEEYHPRLNEAGVTVGVLIAEPTDSDLVNDPPYLKWHGYGAAAVVNVTPEKQRVQGIPDAVIAIDSATWATLDDAGRAALIDHEATHMEPQYSKDGDLKADNHGRPRLKLRLHDREIGIFDEVISRHGLKSIDARNVYGLFDRYRQQCFDWGWSEESAGRDEAPDLEAVAGAIGR